MNLTIGNILQSAITTNQSRMWDNNLQESKAVFKIDPLVCAIAYKRKNRANGLENEQENYTPDDVAKAAEIREYYSKKFFWENLKSNRPQTDFRSNAIRLLSITDEWQLTDRETGLFVKLPCFYEEDIIYDEFRKTLITDEKFYRAKGRNDPFRVELTHLATTLRWQGSKRRAFWFKDANNYLYSITTMDNNPLNSVFEDVVKQPMVYEFRNSVDHVTDMWYNDVRYFKIIKD